MLKGARNLSLVGEEQPTHVDLFVENYDLLKRWALRFTENDNELAEDLLHDAFIQFTLSRPDLSGIVNLESYLFIVMRNLHLSQMRRSTRSALRPVTLVEYDTIEVSFWASDPRDRIRLWDELGAICQYACIRKESSKAGSVLILRFFHGYYPEEIAQVLKTNRSAVEKRLQMARNEAKVYLEDSGSLAFVGDKGAKLGKLPTNSLAGDLRLELRKQIFASRQGNCIELAELKEIYNAEPTDSLGHKTVAHIVSCKTCIESVNTLLDLPPLMSRYPLDTLGKDPGKKGGDDGGTGGVSGGASEMLDSYTSRKDAHFHHQPQELHISVNGQLQSFQKVVSGRSEMTMVIDGPESLGFVEIFSEQGMRLLMLHVEPPTTGGGKQSAHIDLSSGRTVDAQLNFGGVLPVLHVNYEDPELSRHGIADVSEAPNRLAEAIHVPFEETLTEKTSFFISVRGWFDPMRMAIAATLIVSILAGIWFISQPTVQGPQTARAVLAEARNAEFALAPTADKILHRNYQAEEWSNGDLKSRRRVDEWQKPKATARRTYDEQGQMISGRWLMESGHSQVFEQGEKLRTVYKGQEDSTSEFRNEPTANAFANLTDRHGVTARVTAEESANSYTLNFEDRQGETAQTGSSDRLLVGNLILDKNNLMPVSQTLVLQIGNEVREYRYSDIRLEQKPVAEVSPLIFEPEAELVKGATKVTKPVEIETVLNSPPAVGGVAPASSDGVAGAATLETEVEVFKALDSINALSGDQISITRAAGGRLKVVGIVDGNQRKTEILNALSGVRNAPGVVIDVQTAAEAQAKRKQQPGTTGEMQIDSVTAATMQQLAVEPELRAHFAKRGVSEDAMNGEIRSFANSVLNRSEALSRNSLSLKSLAERFSPAEIDRLEPKKRDEWRRLLRSKAAAVSGDVRSLQSQLSLFGVGASGANGGDVKDAAQSAQRLFGLAAACERQINQSFAISNGGGSAAPVKSVQFWRNLAQMADIAADLQRF